MCTVHNKIYETWKYACVRDYKIGTFSADDCVNLYIILVLRRRSNNHPNLYEHARQTAVLIALLLLLLLLLQDAGLRLVEEKKFTSSWGVLCTKSCVYLCASGVGARRHGLHDDDDDDDDGLRAGRSAALRRLPRGPGVRATTSAAHVTRVYARARARSRLYRYNHKL